MYLSYNLNAFSIYTLSLVSANNGAVVFTLVTHTTWGAFPPISIHSLRLFVCEHFHCQSFGWWLALCHFEICSFNNSSLNNFLFYMLNIITNVFILNLFKKLYLFNKFDDKCNALQQASCFFSFCSFTLSIYVLFVLF